MKGRKLIVIAAMVASCTSNLPSPDVPADHPTIEGTARPGMTALSGVTATFDLDTAQPPDPTAIPPTIRPVATHLPVVSYEQKCLEIAPVRPPELDIEGRVVLGGASLFSNQAYIVDALSGQQIHLGSHGAASRVSFVHVSPDRQRIVYRDSGDADELVIAGSDGRPIVTIGWDPDWRLISGWLDDSHVLVSRKGDRRDSLLALDPASGQAREPTIHLPDRYYPDPGPGWYWFSDSQIVYDRTLRRAIFPIVRNGQDNLYYWDLQSDQLIQAFSGTASFGITPTWSPVGERFIISGPASMLDARVVPDPALRRQELFSVEQDGQVTRLTFLTSEHATVRFGEYSWSPNGRYIAFRLYAEPASYPDIYATTVPEISGRLAVLDTVTKAITDYCLPGGLSLVPPIWSPDSRQVIMADYYESDPPIAGNVYLVDVLRGSAVVLAENAMPFGWLSAEP